MAADRLLEKQVDLGSRGLHAELARVICEGRCGGGEGGGREREGGAAREAEGGACATGTTPYRPTLSFHARAMQCPVLTYCMLLPGAQGGGRPDRGSMVLALRVQGGHHLTPSAYFEPTEWRCGGGIERLFLRSVTLGYNT
eukprot:1870887-Rhodomonas_salina.1